MTASRLGAWIAAIVFIADQATKLWGLFIARIVENGPIQVTSFLELTEVWNRGISYGLFQQHTEWGRWLLIIVSAVAAVGFSIWLTRIRDRVMAIALGLLIGGAIGNLVDRIAYGAVFDFIHFHWGSFSWYVFNIADAAIVAGVVGLLYDAVRSRDDVQRTEGG